MIPNEKIPSLKRRDLGIAGAIIALSQLIGSFQNAHSVTSEIAKFKEEFQQSQIDREEFFVRKTDVAALSDKMDKMNENLVRMNEQIKVLKSFMRQDFEASNGNIIGCSARGSLEL